MHRCKRIPRCDAGARSRRLLPCASRLWRRQSSPCTAGDGRAGGARSRFLGSAAAAGEPDLSRVSAIRFLTEIDYPPFNFAGPDGNPQGFNVDLARLICEELKLACTIQMRRFETLDHRAQRQPSATP